MAVCWPAAEYVTRFGYRPPSSGRVLHYGSEKDKRQRNELATTAAGSPHSSTSSSDSSSSSEVMTTVIVIIKL